MRMKDLHAIEEVETLVSIWFWVDTKYANPPPIPGLLITSFHFPNLILLGQFFWRGFGNWFNSKLTQNCQGCIEGRKEARRNPPKPDFWGNIYVTYIYIYNAKKTTFSRREKRKRFAQIACRGNLADAQRYWCFLGFLPTIPKYTISFVPPQFVQLFHFYATRKCCFSRCLVLTWNNNFDNRNWLKVI